MTFSNYCHRNIAKQAILWRSVFTCDKEKFNFTSIELIALSEYLFEN